MSAEKKVDYNFLGKTGVKVSNLCLGTMTFGTTSEGMFGAMYSAPKQTNEADSHKILDRYVELGGNFIDTANIYSHGQSEDIIGSWLKKRKNRDDVIIATKVMFPADMTKPNLAGLSRRNILQSCDDSLKRLQTDYIDLYQAHIWDNATPIEETLQAFDDLVKSGKIRYYGFCNISGWQTQKIVDTAKELKLSPCVTLQQQYSLLSRDSELEAFQVCENEGMGVLPFSPLLGGLLTGKFKKDQVPDSSGSRVGHLKALKESGKSPFSYWEFTNDDKYWKLIGIMENIAKKHGKSVPQLAIRWLLQKDVVASVIIGCTSVQQLEDNMGASVGWEISTEEMKELEEAAPLQIPYPYQMAIMTAMLGRLNRFNRAVKD